MSSSVFPELGLARHVLIKDGPIMQDGQFLEHSYLVIPGADTTRRASIATSASRQQSQMTLTGLRMRKRAW